MENIDSKIMELDDYPVDLNHIIDEKNEVTQDSK